jgi:hypothetical protein
MKPYYTDSHVTIYHGATVTGMRGTNSTETSRTGPHEIERRC